MLWEGSHNILENIKGAIYRSDRFVRELRSLSEIPTLGQFLESNGQDIRLLYRGHCWTSLKREAGKVSYDDDSFTERLEKGMKNLIHHNTSRYIHFVSEFAKGSDDYRKEEYRTFSTMLYYNLFTDRIEHTEFKDMYEALDRMHDDRYRLFMEEISEITSYLMSRLEIATTPLGDDVLPGVELYGCYTREEIFTLVGRQTQEIRMQGAAAGVFHLKEHDATLLFVTLNKSDKDFSPTTQYDDYVIDENHFHWQSQNKDSHSNKGGEVYTRQPERHNKIVLFVREERRDGFGGVSPFHCFGLVSYVESHGDKPMNVTWKVEKPVMAKYLKAV